MNNYATITGYGFNVDHINLKQLNAGSIQKVLDFAPNFKAWLEDVGHYPCQKTAACDWMDALDDSYPDDMNRMGLSRILYAALNEHAAALGYGDGFFDSMKEVETDENYILYVQRFPWEMITPIEKALTPEKLNADFFEPVLAALGIPTSNIVDSVDVWHIEIC